MTQKITVQLPEFDKPIIIENGNMISQESFSNKIAWGWGNVLERYLKGIESICDEFSDDRLKSTLSLSTEATVGENVKKAIDWIIEKLKMLAKLIRDFFKKVGEYLSGGKHAKAISENERAVNALTKIGKSQPDHEIFNRITNEKLVFAYYNAKFWKSSNEETSEIDESFRRVVSNIKDKDVNKIEFGRSSNGDDTVNEFKEHADTISKIISDIEMDSNAEIDTASVMDTNKDKNVKLAIEMVKNYKTTLDVSKIIQTYLTTLDGVLEHASRHAADLKRDRTPVDKNKQYKINIMTSQTNCVMKITRHMISLRLSEKYPKHKQCAMIILLWPVINILINPGDYS